MALGASGDSINVFSARAGVQTSAKARAIMILRITISKKMDPLPSMRWRASRRG
jgi:hypothetical protein